MELKNNSKRPCFLEKLDDILVKDFAYFNYKNYVEKINLSRDEKILEIGCGGGNLSRFLARKAKELTCIDNSEYWIKKSKKRLKEFENIKFKLLDVLEFNKKAYYDAIVISYVLHDIPKGKRKRVIKNLNGCLKEDGEIYIREPIREGHGILPKEIQKLMKNAGFLEVISMSKYSFPLRGKVYERVFKKPPKTLYFENNFHHSHRMHSSPTILINQILFLLI